MIAFGAMLALNAALSAACSFAHSALRSSAGRIAGGRRR
jgi:hypothetical protein